MVGWPWSKSTSGPQHDLSKLAKSELMDQLQPFLMFQKRETQHSKQLTPFLLCTEASSLPENISSQLQDLLFFEACDQKRTLPGQKKNSQAWSYLVSRPHLTGPQVVDAIGRSYLAAREILGRSHAITLLLFHTLNDVAAAKDHGPVVMKKLVLTDKKDKNLSSEEWKIWEDYAESIPARDVRVLERYFGGQHDSPYRMYFLTCAAVVLLAANVYLYSSQ
eukprot:c5945_g1_i1.p1 GENE.c5945_g1_i1~~c5945_g1_i1.p1  ORF type:complete len:220 (-),score=43.71 c5945_g1_i1:191-850(-)